MENLKAEFLYRLLHAGPMVLDDPKVVYKKDATCRWCHAEWGIDAHGEECAWEQARLALHVLARPTRFDG